MTAENNQAGIDNQKRVNRNLAIAVGVLGFGGFALIYVLSFAVMLTRPGMVFKVMPTPSITDGTLSDGSRAYLVVQKFDMSNMNPREKRPPETRHYVTVLNGRELGASQEIPAYESAFGTNGRLVFLSKGGIRTYDGAQWAEERSEAVGRSPVGILTPAGLYVLSKFETGPRLVLMNSGTTSDVPLPAEYLAAEQKSQCPCAKLAWYQGRLCLFWPADDTISWSILNGSAWLPAAISPYSGGYEVLAQGETLYFFHREGDGPARTLSYYIFTNNEWSAEVRLPVQGGFTNWDVFFQQGKLKLFVQQLANQTVYTVRNGNLVDPVRLKGSFSAASFIKPMAFIIVAGNALTILVIFIFSALINRYKEPVFVENETSYEYASLFRRFLATMIDNLVLLVPAAIMIVLLMPKPEAVAGNPFRLLIAVFSALIFFCIGGYLYHSLLEGLWGRTLGKKICGITVLKADFTPCGLSGGFLRNLLRIIDSFFYYLVAVISLAATLKWQRLGDMAASTVVVRDRR